MANELTPIRFSHLLGHSGVGAIVRGKDWLVVVQDTRQWTDRQGNSAGKRIPYVERVRAALGLEQELRTPPVAKELTNGLVDGVCVPATRFPSWMRCPWCGSMYHRPWNRSPWKEQPNRLPHCIHCQSQPQLDQVIWVLAHPKGYLADVPWHDLAHSEAGNPSQKQCKVYDQGYLADVPWHFLIHKEAGNPSQKQCKVHDQLQLIEGGDEGRTLKCRACSANVKFRGDEHLFFSEGRMQPWTKDDLVPAKEEGDKDFAQVMPINDARVYASVTDTVLVIPPESRVRKGTVVDLLYRNSAARSRIDTARTPLARKSALKTLATQYRCTIGDIETALADLDSGYPLYGESFTPGQLRESEFKAFLEELPDQREDEDLVTYNKSDAWHDLGMSANLTSNAQNIVTGVSNLVRVDRLKAIQIFRGFKRPCATVEQKKTESKDPIEATVPPDITGQSNWLPAIELYGEGIFLTLDEDRLTKWEQHPAVVARLKELGPRFVQSGRDEPNPLTSRFMLLHTLSHLLMRQIEAEGGYPAASLTERIYYSEAPEPMAGILICVAVPDIAGSLGGLAELSEPKRFLGILTRALEHSHWCSLDPVCSEHDGQGPSLLNRAACHGCVLVPETACEYANTLLDRSFVKGDAANGLPAFFEMN